MKETLSVEQIGVKGGVKELDSEEECYEYDPDTRALKNEQGAVYYRQVAE